VAAREAGVVAGFAAQRVVARVLLAVLVVGAAAAGDVEQAVVDEAGDRVGLESIIRSCQVTSGLLWTKSAMGRSTTKGTAVPPIQSTSLTRPARWRCSGVSSTSQFRIVSSKALSPCHFACSGRGAK